MKYKCSVHNCRIYIKPCPKEDINQGLVIVLNKPKEDKLEPFMHTDIEENKKDYKLPCLPDGVFVIGAFVKDGARQLSECCQANYRHLEDNGSGRRYQCRKCGEICSLKRYARKD